ncbi:MAG: phosphoribosylanthranilate isomerase [Actinomycetota bacterium]|jgi:phosphoribosylanthranilate isomerase|nr:phosphoribosylanthranilate isomerase [Actinomycetota bacterium]
MTMPGDVMVKICGITSEDDALLAVGLGADALGFVFAPSPRQMSRRAVQQIVERVPREILTVGVFRDEAPARVVEIVNGIGLHAAQLHGSETAEESRWVAARVPMVIKAFPAGHPQVSKSEEFGAGLVLVDAQSPGSGAVFEWRLAEGVVDPNRLVVAGGLHPGNVADAIAHLRPRGVDVSSGVERAPGRKDPRLVREFVLAVRGASGAAEAEDADGSADVAMSGSTGHGGPFDWEVDR